MNYKAKLDSGQEIHLSNQDEQTKISLSSEGNNQSSSFTTGKWSKKPSVYSASDGFVVELATENETQFVSVKSGGIASLDEKPNLDGAKSLELSESDEKDEPQMAPMAPMKPMTPMTPMKPMS
ncbi:MAG TPA: hypothetical protein VF627_10870 [Abditibacterium sp.]|jgi:hypothetical protein